jgi:ComF family protein
LFTRLLAASQRLPSLCAVCRGWGTQRVCDACIERFAVRSARCLRCALRVPEGVRLCGACLTDPPPFARTLAAVDYDHPWDGLITQFKFHGALDLAPALMQRLLSAFERADVPAPTLLLPVPLSRERLRERGYNQAWELARRLGRALHCEADARLLLRVKDTPHQLALPTDRRAGNVRAAFAVEPLRLAELRGRSVTLVDDVMTTGATVAELARVLLQAGAAEVSVWVVARTPRHDDAL